jgi:hypothetical protein
MGENEELGWFPRYIGAQPICNNVPIIEYVGIDTSGNPIYKPKTSCGTIPKPSPTHAERMSSLKSEVDDASEKYKPIIDSLYEEMYKITQVPPFSHPFTNSPRRKARKHYKPKFTL